MVILRGALDVADISPLDLFKIKLDPEQFDDPKLVFGPEAESRIAAALTQVLERANVRTPARAAAALSRPGVRQRAVLHGMAILKARKHMVECVHLGASLGENYGEVPDEGGAPMRPKLMAMQAVAMNDLQALKALGTLIETYEKDPSLPADLRRNLSEVRMRNSLGFEPSDHSLYVPGPVPDTLAEALEGLPGDRTDWIAPEMVSALAQVQDKETGPGAQAFAQKLIWGRAAREYFSFLTRYAGQSKPLSGASSEAMADHRIRALADELHDVVQLPDPNPLLKAAESGRTVVLLAAHAGITDLSRDLLSVVDLPVVQIAAHTKTNLSNPRLLKLGTHGNFQADFLKVVKACRKNPHLVRLFPDGGKGGDQEMVNVAGRLVPVGKGGAMLARQARAQVMFFGTRWRQGKLQFYVHKGPRAEKGVSAAEFDTAFFEFYAKCMEEIAMGPPENMSPGGGFWPHLAGTAARPVTKAVTSGAQGVAHA